MSGGAAAGSGAAAVTVHPAVARSAWRRAWRRADPFLRRGQSFPARVGEVLFSRLEEIRLTPRRVLDYGCRGGSISPLMAERWPEAARIVAGPVREMLMGQPGWGVEADPLRLPFATGSFDLVMASLSLHWSGDLPRALSEARRVLAPGGLFLCAIPGEGTLGELQSALAAESSSSSSASGLRRPWLPDLFAWGDLLARAGFSQPVADRETIHIPFASLPELLTLMRRWGGSVPMGGSGGGPFSPGLGARARLRRLEGLCRESTATPPGEEFPLTVEILFGLGWKG